MEFIDVISTIQSYLAKWGERLNFGNGVAEIVRKSMREKKDEWCDGREKKWISVMRLLKFLSYPAPAREVPPWRAPVHARGSAWMVYQLWQPSCRNCRELRREKIWIVATKLPKMGGKKKKKRIVVAEILGRNFFLFKKCATSTIFLQHFHNKSQVISCY